MSSYAEPRCWSRSAPNTEERVALLRSIQHDDASLALADFKAPHTLDELAATLQATPDALVLAGGTDVGLWVTKQLRTFAPMIYVGEVAELKAIREAVDGIWIGAAVSLSDAWPLLVKQQPTLAEYARRFASPPVCNSGTLGGNVANGSPIGDSMPVLLALGTEIELRAGSSTRQLPLEQFYLGYQRKDLRRGEFLTRIFIPHSPAALRVAAYKVSKRIDQDISAVCAAFAVILEGAQVKSARLAYGGLAAIPKRASHAEAALVGQRWTLATIESAMRALASDFEPLSDMRATREYRLLAASNLLKRFYLEQSGETTSRTFHADVASVAS
jgi:xanthine dehydrogenase small subunit